MTNPTETPTNAGSLKRTALHEWHVAQGGRMVDFAGWELPVFYELGAIEEHHATRRSVGLFDIDHMGQIEIAGVGAIAAIDRLATSDMTTLGVGEAKYGLLCNEAGGVIDDIIVYRTAPEAVLVVVNAANRAGDLAWIQSHVDDAEATIVDRSSELAMIAVQGPNAIALIEAANSTNTSVASLDRFTSTTIELFGASAMVGRTGYTGEDGVELYIDSSTSENAAVDVWTGLLDLASTHNIEAVSVGLGARDSLRFEPGYPLYGHELALDINPFEARLSWAVNLDDHAGDPKDFIGADALRSIKEAGVARRLETLVMLDKGVPREGSMVLDQDGNELGPVVAGMFAPTADVFAANAFIPREFGDVDQELVIDIRGRTKTARVARRPLYRLSDS